jgi:hypothetical protein
MRDIRTRRLAWAALPVAGVLLLAGCSDDDDDKGSDSTSPSASAPATTPTGGATTGAATTGASTPSASAGGAVNPATFSADQKAAAAAYTTVLNPATSAADRKALIQDADKLSGMIDQLLANPLLTQVSAKTGDVKLTGDKGTVSFEILLNGAPAGMPAQDGPVVKQDGKWKVGAKTVCTLAPYAQIQPDAACATY